jgi:exodeoxyribonuclease-3
MDARVKPAHDNENGTAARSGSNAVVKIATWNVNSIKARIGNVTQWLGEAKPDIALFQELKCLAENLPRMELEDLGYNVACVGQKTYNGVALLSRLPLTIERDRLPGDDSDEQARYVEALIELPDGQDKKRKMLRVASIYLPNGNPVGSEKYPYKLGWLDRLSRHATDLLALEEPLVLGGDFNVIPTADDVYDPVGWAEDALFRLETRQHFRKLVNLGLTDAFRALNHEPQQYSFWDYQAGAWQKNHGLRIDHLLLSPQAADRLVASGIDKSPRGKEKPSDHTPVWCELEL